MSGPTTTAAGRLAAAGLAALLVAGVAPAPAAAQPTQWWHSTWQMPDVWDVTDGTGVTVGVLDSGVDATVPDLAGAVVPGTDFTGGSDDGLLDVDSSGHGTAMASLIASRGSESGLVGMAPNSTILPVVTSPGEESETRGNAGEFIANGIRYAVDHGAEVVNISQGILLTEPCPEQVGAAVRYAISEDVVVVAGSGNTADGDTPPPGGCPGTVTVGAVGPDLEPWEDSHRSEYVDVAAPGEEMSAIGRDGEVRPSGGTSAATALVSGALALIRAAHPDESADEVVTRLLASAEDVGEPGRDDATGHGLVRPLQALTEPVPPDASNPIYEGLDLTDVADPFAPPSEPVADVPPPAAAGDSGTSPRTVLVVAAVGGILLFLLLVALIITVLVVRAGRRPRQQPGPPGSPGPPTG